MKIFLFFFSIIQATVCLTRFTVPESAQIGFRIGWISGKQEESVAPKYFVVFPDEQTSKFLKVDERSGEISTIAHLDYEKRSKFEIVAVRVEESGETIDILVEVDDENDNVPSFADSNVKFEISEFAQLGTSFALPTVSDGDGPKFDVHRFVILQGNVNNVFKITARKVNEQLQADLFVNGQLDREFRDKYELLIEAQDGGKPAKTGQLRCSIEIVDANDNAPVFTRSRYTASVSANVSIGSNIITVQATDADIGENSRISYEIKKTSSPSNSNFAISPSGVITTTSSLLPASTHDVIVVASDHGNPPLSSSAVVTISVMGSTLASPPLDIIWLVESNSAENTLQNHYFHLLNPRNHIENHGNIFSAHLPENTTLGSIVARVSIAQMYRDTKLRLLGTSSLCPQQTDQSHVYLLLLCGILDRETTSEYHLKFLLEKDGQMIIEHPQLLTIGDINDNAPQWHSSQIHISLNRTQGGSRTLTAKDPDLGQNGWIRYSVLDTDLVSIDKETGRIFVPNTVGQINRLGELHLRRVRGIDCNIGSEIKFRVRAEDGGNPALSTDLQVIADLLDSESRPPQFERALWQVEISEDTPVGTCLVKVGTFLFFKKGRVFWSRKLNNF
ncbi:Protein CBG15736 [Caenorhabditis briggsae]|uniref:Protein CBG15736 n=1 Tax=Caenorhabditis briggsae TaxID=6238 RepID=A8XMN5_CAEBR|nr:Protein CBG15736 [Caenorhabditis briggsae]CAP33911.2 Protein CBG15736 [Caenorhabditis briggsae]